jgi:preprotein translocase subunit YajC
MTTETIQIVCEQYALADAEDKERAKKKASMRAFLLDSLKSGERVETENGIVCRESAECLEVDDATVQYLKDHGYWRKVRKTTVDVPKVRALAKICAAVRNRLKTKTVDKLSIR